MNSELSFAACHTQQVVGTLQSRPRSVCKWWLYASKEWSWSNVQNELL